MTVGALLDAGAPAAPLIEALETLDMGAKFEVEKTRRGGVTASKFRVIVPSEAHPHRHADTGDFAETADYLTYCHCVIPSRSDFRG